MALFEPAIERGITFFDTAPSCGAGTGERDWTPSPDTWSSAAEPCRARGCELEQLYWYAYATLRLTWHLSLIPSLSCRRCSPHPSFAKLEVLTGERLDGTEADATDPGRRTRSLLRAHLVRPMEIGTRFGSPMNRAPSAGSPTRLTIGSAIERACTGTIRALSAVLDGKVGLIVAKRRDRPINRGARRTGKVRTVTPQPC